MSCMHCSCSSCIPMGAEQSAASTIFQCSLSKQSLLLVEFFQYLKWHVFVEGKVSHQCSRNKISTASCVSSDPPHQGCRIRLFPVICILFPKRHIWVKRSWRDMHRNLPLHSIRVPVSYVS